MSESKIFYTINHELLRAKLNPYGLSKQTLLIIFSYLNNRKQRVKINNKWNSGNDLIQEVPQVPVFGSLQLNINLRIH